MTRRKAHRAPKIPNSITTEEAAASWSAAVDNALATVRGRTSLGRRFPHWGLIRINPSKPAIASNMALLASGESEQFDFGPENIEDFVCWLDDADWLDAFPMLPPLGDHPQRELRRLLDIAGDLGQLAHFRQDLPPGLLLLAPTLVALAILRWSWRLSCAMQRADLDEVATLWASFHATGLSRRAEPGGAQLVPAVRKWLASNLLVFDIVPFTGIDASPLHLFPPRPFVPFTVPKTPMELVMLAIAAGAGIADAPVLALHVCDYRPCGRVFVGDRSGVRGSNRFCSPRCGKRFHSTRHTYARRAAAKANHQPGPEGD